MHDVQMADRARLEMRWLPVADDQGRTHMQAVWIPLSAAVQLETAHHAA